MNFFESILVFYKEGGFFMHPILAVGLFGAAIFIERFLYLNRSSINGNHFMARIQSFLISNNSDEAIKFSNSAPNKPLARIIKNGLIRAPKGEKEVVHALEVSSLEEIPKLQQRLPYLAMCANVATLFGLLGTIIGIIIAFHGMVAIDPALRQATLARGISEALHATALGLLVAIPSLMGFTFLQSQSFKIMDDIDKSSMKLVDLLKAKDSSGGSANAA
jgi:biopolymer transport protein ExbB/TolQ